MDMHTPRPLNTGRSPLQRAMKCADRIRTAILLYILGINAALGDKITCQITMVETLLSWDEASGQQYDEPTVACIPITEHGVQSDDYYPVSLPENISVHYKNVIQKAALYVDIPGSELGNVIEIPGNATFRVKREQDKLNQRLLAREKSDIRTTGKFTLALIRVSTTDAAPTIGAKEYYDTIFNSNTSITRQLHACSHHKFKFKPALKHTLDIKLDDMSASYTSRSELLVAASKIVRRERHLEFVSQLADKVFFMLPPIPHLPGFLAFSGIGFYRSVYNDAWAVSLSATIHETGHGLGLHHAQRHDSNFSYSDTAGYMGAGSLRRDYPLKCFNGAYSWQLGWYKDHHLDLDPVRSGPRLVRISALTHVDRISEGQAYSIVKVGNFHLIYNRATGPNRDASHADELTITKSTATNSHHMSSLKLHGTWKHHDFEGNNIPLVITVCKKATISGKYDSLVVSIGMRKSYCGAWSYLLGESHAPTTQPTNVPTSSPTSFPTNVPSAKPTEVPSYTPSNSPTLDPTMNPTTSPSQWPSLMPTFIPTSAMVESLQHTPEKQYRRQDKFVRPHKTAGRVNPFIEPDKKKPERETNRRLAK